MERLTFIKMCGAGNDFIVLDGRRGLPFPSLSSLVKRLCKRKFSIGADGVLILEESQLADFKMRYFNADGGEAEMCGNGARCIAKFAQLMKVVGQRAEFETTAGLHQAEIDDYQVRLHMVDPREIELNVDLNVGEKRLTVHRINTGVPHLVMVVNDVKEVSVNCLGRKIRHHEKFQPLGVNIDFAQIMDENHLMLRTYERGVEEETYACGTGAAAAAVISSMLALTKPPVDVITSGGEPLRLSFDLVHGKAQNVWLEGEVRVIYEGFIEL